MFNWIPKSLVIVSTILLVAPAAPAAELTELWPVEIGRRLNLEGTQRQGVGGANDPLQIELTMAREEQLPGGKTTVEIVGRVLEGPARAKGPAWPFEIFPIGQLLLENARLGLWLDAIGDWVWSYFDGDPGPAANWQMRPRPSFEPDVWLSGTVVDDAATTLVTAGSYSNVVIVDYVLDGAPTPIVDGGGSQIGTYVETTSGTVYWATGVGPIRIVEDFSWESVDCFGGCPEEALDGVSQYHAEAELSSTALPLQEKSFGELKAEHP